jgi:hypothetical protein
MNKGCDRFALWLDFEEVGCQRRPPADSGQIPSPPSAGLWRFLLVAAELFDVRLFSTKVRQDQGAEAMRDWIEHWMAFRLGRELAQGLMAHVRFEVGAPEFTWWWRFEEGLPHAQAVLALCRDAQEADDAYRRGYFLACGGDGAPPRAPAPRSMTGFGKWHDVGAVTIRAARFAEARLCSVPDKRLMEEVEDVCV